MTLADALEGMTPDEEHFHEATGNEGASFDRTYARAALVLWPLASRLAVLNQAGLGATLPYLEHQAKQWHADGARADAPIRAEALKLARHVLATWPQTPFSRVQANGGDRRWRQARELKPPSNSSSVDSTLQYRVSKRQGV